MKTWIRHTPISQQPVTCRCCQQPIVVLPQVGWVLDVQGANTYDMCEGDALCNHAPEVVTVSA